MDYVPDVPLKRSRGKSQVLPEPWEPWLFMAGLGVSEIISDVLAPLLGIWLHALLAGILLWRGTRLTDRMWRYFYWILAILPLVRIISFAISAHSLPGVWYYVMAETPLMVAGFVGQRVTGVPWRQLGVRWPRLALVGTVTVVSAPALGWVESRIIHPAALIPSLTWAHALLPSILLVIFTGVSEEILFRGLVQYYATRVLGRWTGVIFVALSWSLLHIGWQSGVDVVFVFFVGVLWGWVREKTQSLGPTAAAHGLANIVLFLIVPFTH